MLSVHFDLLNLLWFWLTVLDWTAGIPGKISVNKLSVDLIPNSLKRKHHRNCMAQSKENHWWDLGSERVKLSEVLFLDHQVSDELHPNPSPPPAQYQLIVDRSTVVQLFDSFLCDVVSPFSSSFLVFVVVVHFFKGVLYRIMCDFCVWLGLKTLAWWALYLLYWPCFIIQFHSEPKKALYLHAVMYPLTVPLRSSLCSKWLHTNVSLALSLRKAPRSR